MPTERPEVQKRSLGAKGLLVYLILANMFVPFSTDMYLPALPSIGAVFQAGPALVNLSLTCFFLAHAFSVLFWGPLSDKYGRRPCLIWGSLLYTGASLASALAGSIYLLVLFRLAQGVAVGAISTMATAIVKDSYQGQKRGNVLALIYTLCGIAPMAAAILGGQLLRVAPWNFSFAVLAGFGLASLVFALRYQETLREEERYQGKLRGAWKQLAGVVKNRSFFYPVLIFALMSAPFMGYLAVSAYIFQLDFGLSEQAYSYYFSINAGLGIFAPLIYIRFFRRVSKKAMGYVYTLGTAVAGLLLLAGGHLGPVAFLLCFFPFNMLFSSVSTYSVNWIMDQQTGESGSAASVISVTGTAISSLCMLAAPLFTNDFISGLAWLIIGFGCLAGLGWGLFLRSSLPCLGVKA